MHNIPSFYFPIRLLIYIPKFMAKGGVFSIACSFSKLVTMCFIGNTVSVAMEETPAFYQETEVGKAETEGRLLHSLCKTQSLWTFPPFTCPHLLASFYFQGHLRPECC